MRVHLACTVRGDRSGVAAGRAICDRLQANGHTVLTMHLLNDDANEREAALSEQAVFCRDLEWLSSCDVLVAETSGSSYGVGHAVSRLIARNCHEACETLAYGSIEQLTQFIDARSAPPAPVAGVR